MQAQQLAEAQAILREHEAFISNVLQMETVQDQRFADFPGAVKSLGAWGGDFVMILSDWPAEQVRHYFLERDCPIVLAYAEMVR